MHRTALTILLLLLTSSVLYPCVNPIGERYRVGKPIDLKDVDSSEYVLRLTATEGSSYWADLLQQLKEQEKNENMEVDTNVAVALVYLGKYKEALRIFKKIEIKYPDSYSTAANIGTTYELLGQNALALRWIKESLRRDPESHHGTEWLHIKILEVKIALENDPKWLERNTVLGLDWDEVSRNQSVEFVVTDYAGKKKTAKEIEDALVYQLHERMAFVIPPEPIVAQLLFDLSNILVTSRSPQHAKAVHQLAVNYGHRSIAPVVAAVAAVPIPPAPDTSTPHASRDLRLIGAVSGSVLTLLLLAGYYLYRRRRIS